MWSRTVDLRTRPVWDQKIILGLAGLVLCCVVKHGLVTHVVIIILKDTSTFQVLFIVSLFWSWNVATVEINNAMETNSVVHLLKNLIWQVLSFTSGGLGLGLKNLVLFTIYITVKKYCNCKRHCLSAELMMRSVVEDSGDVVDFFLTDSVNLTVQFQHILQLHGSCPPHDSSCSHNFYGLLPCSPYRSG